MDYVFVSLVLIDRFGFCDLVARWCVWQIVGGFALVGGCLLWAYLVLLRCCLRLFD